MLHVVGVNVTCTADTLTMTVLMEQPFQGLLYAWGFPLECMVQGTGGTDVTLHLPATRCGVRVLSSEVSSLLLQVAEWVHTHTHTHTHSSKVSSYVISINSYTDGAEYIF